jgi:hypothetical protein
MANKKIPDLDLAAATNGSEYLEIYQVHPITGLPTSARIQMSTLLSSVVASGVQMVWRTATTGSPASGNMRADNATFASMTQLVMSEADLNGADIGGFIRSFDDSTSVVKGYLHVVGRFNVAIERFFAITGSVTDNGTDDSFAVTPLSTAGTWTNGLVVQAIFYRNGDAGNAADTAALIHAATGKTTPVDADELALVDSAASNVLKKLTWANLKATLKTYFDTLYLPLTIARREVLTADRTYYVRGDGLDTHDGLTNTAGGAFLTVAKAIDVVAGIDFGAFAVTIQIGAGTWTPNIVPKAYVGAGPLTFKGDPTTPSNVVINVTGRCFNIDAIPGKIVLDGFKLVSTSIGILANNGSAVEYKNIEFGACTWQMYASGGSIITATGNYSISGGGAHHAYAEMGSSITIFTRTLTITGTPAFSTAFAFGTRCGVVICTFNTYSGSATGKRYDAANGGGVVIGADTLPGNVAGTFTSPGWIS